MSAELSRNAGAAASMADDARAAETLGTACTQIVLAGKAEPSAVIRVRAALLNAPETNGLLVNGAQAAWLSTTNEAIAFARNASAWRALYAGALASYLATRATGAAGVPELGLARWLDLASSVDAVPVPETSGATWLIRQVGRSQNVSPADQALVGLLKRHAPGLIGGLGAA